MNHNGDRDQECAIFHFAQNFMENNQNIGNDKAMSIQRALEDLLQKGTNINVDLKAFLELYSRFVNSDSAEDIDWSQIQALGEQSIIKYEHLEASKENIAENMDVSNALSRLVAIKYNADLGSSVNHDGTKSLIPVKNGKTFIDLTYEQIDNLNTKYNSNIPLYLINSFKTQKETEDFLKKMPRSRTSVETLLQNTFPRLSEETKLPVPESRHLSGSLDPKWYVPGDGDVFRRLQESGLLQRFINEGKEWIFFSNIDNLGATPDPSIICWLEEQRKKRSEMDIDILIEITNKLTSDFREGSIVHYKGKFRFIEISQVTKEHKNEFYHSEPFQNFTTNSFWIRLKALKELLESESLSMDLRVHRGIMKDGRKIIQLEESAASAVSSFKKTMALKVPRSRFLPIRSTSELLILQSDIFVETQSGLMISPRRLYSKLPSIELGSRFQSFKDLQRRMPSIPSMVNIKQLSILGDVYFGKNVTLKGYVKFNAKNNEKMVIPEDAVFEDEVVVETFQKYRRNYFI